MDDTASWGKMERFKGALNENGAASSIRTNCAKDVLESFKNVAWESKG